VAHGLKVDDPRMSKLHFRIDGAEGRMSLSDAGSMNGTFVNGRAVSEAVLAFSDVIRAGDTLLVVKGLDLAEEARLRSFRAARSDFPVLILGETGTGKELLARFIHESSGRSGDFVPVNCATLPRELAAAELFGHARGAFSGAATARAGLFRTADGGTLFLDEVGDLPLDLQPALLRALEERKVRPVGTEHEVSISARIIAATHVDVETAVQAGRFREDLLARLAHIVIRLPALRDRRADILKLAQGFAGGLVLSHAAAEALMIADWPRNIRELKAVIESTALLVGDRQKVELSDLADRIPGAVDRVRQRSVPPEAARARGEEAGRRERVRLLLEQHRGNVSMVARELGKPRAQVYRWLKALGLDVDDFRASSGEE
jgi:two-component system response regulator HydG